MRQIKFRGKETSKPHRWIIGHHYEENGASFIWVNGEMRNWPIEVDAETIGQYVGLNDMHGKEIYEGDVLMVEGIKTNRYSKVWWNPEKFTFYIGHSPLDAYIIDDGRLREFRIAGNIYDNPELKDKLV